VPENALRFFVYLFLLNLFFRLHIPR